ncbi:hypothetical protein DCO58_08925 [Helicobacter saguini]|uniref:acylphosphatase n=1 Tax=Helicobacter saguini TaxID=1548018 RepID=A0A347VLG2_9HELI|nr:Sua5/YciO/YrdC/YwlC family protein [Helicobacter saguini]MWV61557.1 hypothetical protein [Helicobacter saguini]MWV67773.1 hypothetical protein [Helicobacter saguini]MWV70759.1 hypothetical protein [Helicobacter saguini]MWV72663.1 hypothetical protein [Helicobacter saguini]TLD94533.1 carbamoyltransferase HypF [Helicobacter saguini]
MQFCFGGDFIKFLEYMQNLDSKISKFNAIKITNFGIVQGVGFRPFVYNLACNLDLNGYVKNLGDSAEIMLGLDSKLDFMANKESKLDSNVDSSLDSGVNLESNLKSKANLDSKKLENLELFFLALLDICGNYLRQNLDSIESKIMINRYFNKKNSILHNIFLPKNANIESIEINLINTKVMKNFSILESSFKKHNILELQLPLDYRICKDCLKDLRAKSSRFYNYAFTTCVNCGARFSLLKNLPYDRKNTSMSEFSMCESCLSDYEMPQNRRFHTQPLSCPKCKISLCGFYLDSNNFNDFRVNLDSKNHNFKTKKFYDLQSIKECANALKNNKVILFKGLGGYAYLANARSDKAIMQIREIKKRKTKPFAVMGKLESLQKIAILDKKAKDILESNETPILITLKNKSYDLSNFITPFESIGVMIPYTAILELLFSFLDSNFIMLYTSANIKGEMIAKNLDELFSQKIIESNSFLESFGIKNLDSKIDSNHNKKLENLELFILKNNREIVNRLDDSIINNLHFEKKLQNIESNKNTKKILDSSNLIFNLKNSKKHNFIRISRGYSPKNFHFKNLNLKTLSASFGAMQKSSLCFGFKQNAIISPYLGDLFSPKNVENFMENFKFFSKLYGSPKLLITDKHQGYESSKMAQIVAQDSNTQILSIYHHHAHLNALLLEANLSNALGVIFDGSGLGSDNTIWGGEFLSGNFKTFTRLMHFKPFRILGGEKHIKDCKRLALSYALSNNIKEILQILESNLNSEYKILQSMQKSGINSPLTSSVGRLFDIAGFILGLDFNNLDSKKISNLETLEYEAQSGEIISNLALKYLIDSNQIQINARKNIKFIESKFNPYPYEIINNEINLAKTFKNMYIDIKNITPDSKYSRSLDSINSLNLDSINPASLDSKNNLTLNKINSLNYNFNILDKKLQIYELNKGKIALKFIDTLCFVILDSIKKIGADFALFGGGVFSNFILNARLKMLLDSEKKGYFFPQMPCNDYSISLGQLAFASEK